jgi:hypothetical protein
LYVNAVKQEQQKLETKRHGKSSKHKAEEASSDSDSDSNISMHMVTQLSKVMRVPSKSQSKKARSETTDKETEYQKIIGAKWLQDYGEVDIDAIHSLDTDDTSKGD